MATASNKKGLTELTNQELLDMEHNHQVHLDYLTGERAPSSTRQIRRKITSLEDSLKKIGNEIERRGLREDEQQHIRL